MAQLIKKTADGRHEVEITIKGDTGAGKTMLMEGIGKVLLDMGFNVVCSEGEEGPNHRTEPTGWYLGNHIIQDEILIRTETRERAD